MKRRTKESFIRIIILVAKAETSDEIKNLLTTIFIVSLSANKGVSASKQTPTPCEIRKKELLAKISGFDLVEQLEDIEETDNTIKEKNMAVVEEKIPGYLL